MQDKIKYILRILIIILLNVCVAGAAGYAYQYLSGRQSVAVLSKIGSRGDEVREIQQRLSQLGFYTGESDGVFGSGTAAALKEFQQSKGLTVDGVAGNATMKALGIGGAAAPAGSWADADYQLLARLISAEAGGQSHLVQVAVGAVALNRLEHPSFPDTIPGVVYQPGMFAEVGGSQWEQPVSQTAYRAAKEAFNGSDPSGGALYYYKNAATAGQYLLSRRKVADIGGVVFCG